MNVEELGLLIEHLTEQRTPGFEIEISADDIYKVCDAFYELKQQAVIRIAGPCYVVGDVHGQFQDVLTYFSAFGADKTYVFLGDYVDRGYQNVETVLLLMALKLQSPGRLALLRGNHELDNVCSSNEAAYFSAEIRERYPNDSEEVLTAFLRAFSNLPLAAVINDQILCVHGCVPHSLDRMEQLEQIQLPMNPNEPPQTLDKQMVSDLLWSDPVSATHIERLNLSKINGAIFNRDRNTAEWVPETDVAKFLDDNKLVLLLRGHQAVDQGMKLSDNGRIWTVFGASNWRKTTQAQGSCVVEVDAESGLRAHFFRSDM